MQTPDLWLDAPAPIALVQIYPGLCQLVEYLLGSAQALRAGMSAKIPSAHGGIISPFSP